MVTKKTPPKKNNPTLKRFNVPQQCLQLPTVHEKATVKVHFAFVKGDEDVKELKSKFLFLWAMLSCSALLWFNLASN